MRLAYRSRPGISGPSHRAAIGAVCLAAAAGFYGFATSVQKAATLRSAAGAGVAIVQDDARTAVPLSPTPTLVYALTEGRPTDMAEAAPPPPPVATPAAETVVTTEDVSLVSQPLVEAPPPLEVVTAGPLPLPPAVVPAVTPAEQPLAIPPPAAVIPTP